MGLLKLLGLIDEEADDRFAEEHPPTMGGMILDKDTGEMVYLERRINANHIPPPAVGFRKLYEGIRDWIIGYN